METHLQGLTGISKQGQRVIPATAACFSLERLGFRDDLLVAATSPEALVVVGATGFVGLVGLHLGLTEILKMGKKMSIHVGVVRESNGERLGLTSVDQSRNRLRRGIMGARDGSRGSKPREGGIGAW